MSQQLQFSKMHGLGNDFVVINAIDQTVPIDQAWIRHIADRHRGIGFDQLLIIEPSHRADFACRFFNADGTEAEQCGNGIRCVARFIQEEQLSDAKSLSIETKAGIVAITIYDFEKIEVNMGQPIFAPDSIPFVAKHVEKLYAIDNLTFAALSMGNPHAIFLTPSIKNCPLLETALLLKNQGLFPHDVNIGFIEIIDREHVQLRTLERGVGETYACGTNACAAVVAGIINDWLDHKVTVNLKYGRLFIEWQGENHPVLMTGPAATVFTGIIRD